MVLPALFAAATAIKAGADILGAKEQSKAANERAAALQQQAKRRLEKSRLQAGSVLAQGQMDQTSYASRLLSSGAVDRSTLASDTSLDEITQRAKLQADLIMEDAEYDANTMRQDAIALGKAAKNAETAAYIGAAGSILGGAYKYYSAMDVGGSATNLLKTPAPDAVDLQL